MFINNRVTIQLNCLGYYLILCFCPSIIKHYASFDFSKCLSVNYRLYDHLISIWMSLAFVLQSKSGLFWLLGFLIFFARSPNFGVFSYILGWCHPIDLLRHPVFPTPFHRASAQTHFNLVCFLLITDATMGKKY